MNAKCSKQEVIIINGNYLNESEIMKSSFWMHYCHLNNASAISALQTVPLQELRIVWWIRVRRFFSLHLKYSLIVRRVDVKSKFMKMGNRNVHGTIDRLCGSCNRNVHGTIDRLCGSCNRSTRYN